MTTPSDRSRTMDVPELLRLVGKPLTGEQLAAVTAPLEPTVVVAGEDEVALIKSFRNLSRVLVTVPAELEVAHVVWARSLVVSEAALPLVQGRCP